jgi:hypothetical protein
MADSKKTRAIAGHLIKKHGRAAAAVVMGKMKDCAAVGDHEGARAWSEVADAITTLLRAGLAAAAGDEPPLGARAAEDPERARVRHAWSVVHARHVEPWATGGTQ